MKVLIADDDRVFVELLATRLRAEGAEVVIAFDSMQAVMHAMRAQPDVILLDLKMPGGNGMDVLRKIKASTRGGAASIIVVTALEQDGLPAELERLGAAGLVRKPASPATVISLIHRVLGTVCTAS